MKELCENVLIRLQGKTLVTAESLTGGMIGSALTSVPGASNVYRGGVICYVNDVKREVLGVPAEVLEKYGPVSAQTAGFMASGVRKLLDADYAIAVTGLAGPAGDDFGNEVGTVYIGFESQSKAITQKYHFTGDREAIRRQTVTAALELVLEYA